MKLLVSDYDGTFNSDNRNLQLNIKAIEKFRQCGNKFVIATGRNYESIKWETDYHGIQYDYLICNNGLIVFDDKNNILKSSILDESDLELLYEYLTETRQIDKLQLYNSYSTTDVLKNILEIYARFVNIQSAKICETDLNVILPNIHCYRENRRLFISQNITKADAVSFIQERENIDKENVYTVGDNKNDLEMLQQFNGYKMLYSYPCMWMKNIPITREVHTLVKKINKR